ncbi:type II secretion system F family protein [Alisedimentitalea sp. MJ-SS2]|uniref:type II secretion system F family protein n=1 Tax=Aliisedimentitalea sp. MJ-SS2 TaxID=3049795 RepID=UPI00290C0510|nr:type II secretion system F family protein [Alisedimentitalea sp. MJ-SS2]MDU8926087.1 type II secretion system F family protein [Alisedimentitalea sp. MJ-SS2]
MDAINQFLTEQFGPMGSLMAAGFLGVVMILITLPFLLKKDDDPLDKLKKSTKAAQRGEENKEALRAKQRNDKLAKYSQFLEPKTEEELQGMKLKLMQAGYRDRDAVRYFHFAQFALGIGFLILGVIYYIVFLSGGETNTQQTLMYILGPGAAGYMLPKYWVTRRQGARQEEITNGFPDALDMMLVCVEAGQSMDQAILRVSGEIRASYPSLADEFEIVSHEMKAGKDKTAVLNDMAERAGVQDVASFVTVLNQSQSFGTPISDALRVYAGEMRDKRVMRAEEAANKLPTKMTLATMMLTVPPLLIILVGPSVHGISMLGNMGQH